jgi:hypothetical protein
MEGMKGMGKPKGKGKMKNEKELFTITNHSWHVLPMT